MALPLGNYFTRTLIHLKSNCGTEIIKTILEHLNGLESFEAVRSEHRDNTGKYIFSNLNGLQIYNAALNKYYINDDSEAHEAGRQIFGCLNGQDIYSALEATDANAELRNYAMNLIQKLVTAHGKSATGENEEDDAETGNGAVRRILSNICGGEIYTALRTARDDIGTIHSESITEYVLRCLNGLNIYNSLIQQTTTGNGGGENGNEAVKRILNSFSGLDICNAYAMGNQLDGNPDTWNEAANFILSSFSGEHICNSLANETANGGNALDDPARSILCYLDGSTIYNELATTVDGEGNRYADVFQHILSEDLSSVDIYNAFVNGNYDDETEGAILKFILRLIRNEDINNNLVDLEDENVHENTAFEFMLRLANNEINELQQNDLEGFTNPINYVVSQALSTKLGEMYNALVNGRDEEGNTPLYLAAKLQNERSSRTLIQGESDLDIRNNRGKSPIVKLFGKLPGIMGEQFKEGAKNSHYLDSEGLEVALYLRALIGKPMDEDIRTKSYVLYRELDLLSNISFTPLPQRAQLLDHTHLKILVWCKWQNYKWIFWITRILQILWCLLYFFFLLTFYRVNCPIPSGKIYNFFWFSPVASTVSVIYPNNRTSLPLFSERDCVTTSMTVIAWILLVVAALDLVLVEIYPITVRLKRKWNSIKTRTPMKYLKHALIFIQILHLGKLAFLLTIFINILPIIVGDTLPVQWQYGFAAIGIYGAWFQIFLDFGKIPHFKGYIKIFTNTICTLSIVAVLYLPLVFAFATIFCLLFPGKATFASPFEAIARMSTFAIGEVDFVDMFYEDEASSPVLFLLAVIFFPVAIVILHIALLNFLISLTIKQLQDVWNEAESWKTYTYLWQIFLFESFLSNLTICPSAQKFLENRRLLRTNYEEKPVFHLLRYKIEMKQLPKTLRRELGNLDLEYRPMGGGW